LSNGQTGHVRITGGFSPTVIKKYIPMIAFKLLCEKSGDVGVGNLACGNSIREGSPFFWRKENW